MERQILDHFRDDTKMVEDQEFKVTLGAAIAGFLKKKRPAEAGRQAGNAIPGGEKQSNLAQFIGKSFYDSLRALHRDQFRKATELIP